MSQFHSFSALSTPRTSMRRVLAIVSLLLIGATCVLISPSAKGDEISCSPVNVVVFANRVHVQCAASVGGIYFFAAPVNDSAHVARVLNVLSTATVAGRTVAIFYDPADTSGASFGCQPVDCRRLTAAGFWQ